jgi:hypothetical protein
MIETPTLCASTVVGENGFNWRDEFGLGRSAIDAMRRKFPLVLD